MSKLADRPRIRSNRNPIGMNPGTIGLIRSKVAIGIFDSTLDFFFNFCGGRKNCTKQTNTYAERRIILYRNLLGDAVRPYRKLHGLLSYDRVRTELEMH